MTSAVSSPLTTASLSGSSSAAPLIRARPRTSTSAPSSISRCPRPRSPTVRLPLRSPVVDSLISHRAPEPVTRTVPSDPDQYPRTGLLRLLTKALSPSIKNAPAPNSPTRKFTPVFQDALSPTLTMPVLPEADAIWEFVVEATVAPSRISMWPCPAWPTRNTFVSKVESSPVTMSVPSPVSSTPRATSWLPLRGPSCTVTSPPSSMRSVPFPDQPTVSCTSS